MMENLPALIVIVPLMGAVLCPIISILIEISGSG